MLLHADEGNVVPKRKNADSFVVLTVHIISLETVGKIGYIS
jgi:hypothetical protein